MNFSSIKSLRIMSSIFMIYGGSWSKRFGQDCQKASWNIWLRISDCLRCFFGDGGSHLQKPINFYWSGRSISLTLQSLVPGGAFSDDKIWVLAWKCAAAFGSNHRNPSDGIHASRLYL
jgi:hypothetical protein